MLRFRSSLLPFGFLVFVLSVGFFGPNVVRAQEMISDGTRAYLDLGGEWDVQKIDGIEFAESPENEGWHKEEVPAFRSKSLKYDHSPYGAALSTYLTEDKQELLPVENSAAWFRRKFDLPEELPEGQRAYLNFGGMAFKSEIWLNGEKLGGSDIGQLPQSFDVTDVVEPGDNELLVALAGRPALVDVARQTLTAPVSGVAAGIWGEVKLEFMPATSIGRVFIDTSVQNEEIEIRAEVRNQSDRPQTLSVSALIRDRMGNPLTQIEGQEVRLSPGESREVVLAKEWIAPELWSPSNPALIVAEVSLEREGKRVDDRLVRFGFREFEIRGRDFYLNGVRTTLLRNSSLRALPTSREEIFSQIRSEAMNPYNAIRMHIGFNAEAMAEIADELGVMLIPESGWHNINNKFSIENSEGWLPAVEEYTRGLMELHYNHPSVVMWNLTNETFWGDTDDTRMAIADRLVEVAREVDPHRPLDGDGEVSWGGRLDAINIHYPESSVGNSLRAEYSNSSFVFPNDYHWLSKDGENTSWRAKFVWDRPLVIGEYWFPTGGPDKLTSFMGESVYDWEKWTYRQMSGRGDLDDGNNSFVDAQKGLADAYRMQGVASLNPWASDGDKVLPQLAVRPVDFFPNFYGGQTVARKFVVFNDSGRRYNSMRLQCRIHVDGLTLWEKMVGAGVGPGEYKTFEIPVEVPEVIESMRAELSIRLIHERGNYELQLSRYDQTVFLMPKPSLADVDASKLKLLDPSGLTEEALASLGLHLAPTDLLTSESLKGVDVVLVGGDADLSKNGDALVSFAESGGAVIVLRQEEWTPLAPELPEMDQDHVATRSWKRVYDHPVTEGLDDEQLSYWRPDHIVSLGTFRKPATGPAQILIDAGGRFGLRWSPLVEVPVGEGVFLMTSMPLVPRVEVEPAAAEILSNLIRYAVDYEAADTQPLRLLSGDNPPLRKALKASGVVVEDGLDEGSGPVLLDASYEPTRSEIAQLKEYLSTGGFVWLHGFTSETLSRVGDLFPFEPALEARDPEILSAARRSDDPILNNLSSFDFFWCKVDLGKRKGYFNGAEAMSPLGGEVLQLPYLQAGIRLIEPGLLVKVPVGAGALLFDTLEWEDALGFETDKATRVAASLAGNLGATVRTTVDRTQYDYFQVDLSSGANMGYYDPEPDDGTGGWTDQGQNDMRFFLINHVGRQGGLETEMEIEAEIFPENVKMAGRPFLLPDPRKHEGKTVVSLRGGSHGEKLPSSVEGIQVGRKADKLWFLHGAGWAPEMSQQVVGRYVIHYADGSESIFPIRYGIEISEWWGPVPIAGAEVAWTGTNLKHTPIGIYVTEWDNPFPEKEIDSVDLIGDLSPTQLVILAISGGVVKGDGIRKIPVGEWEMGNFDGSVVPNRLGPEGALHARDPAPVLAEDGGGFGLEFREGAELYGDSRVLPHFGGFGEEGQAFYLEAEVNPFANPVGYYGGIFQAAEYGKKGFRLMIDKRSKLVVQWFNEEGTEGFTSPTTLEFGRNYQVELQFDGHYVTLFIDGRVDIMKETALPAAYQGMFKVGNASGRNYTFNGIISEMKLGLLSEGS